MSAGEGRVPLALLLLVHNKGRTAMVMSGMVFAFVFMLLQLGFLGASLETAVAVPSRLNADLVIVATDYLHLGVTGRFPRQRLIQARAVKSVRTASPLYLGYAPHRDPSTGRRAKVLTLGLPLRGEPALLNDEVNAQIERLELSDVALMDRLSQRKCEPLGPGSRHQIWDATVEVVGNFDLGVGFLDDGIIAVGEDGFASVSRRSLDQVNIGLVRLERGTTVGAAVAELRDMLPRDVQVLTRRQLESIQERHWVLNTSVGNIFGLGTLVGFCVGFVDLYQCLASDITNLLPQFATLKAMGYGERRLYAVVLEQALLLGVSSCVIALGIAHAIYTIAHVLTRYPVSMTPERVGGMLATAVVVCGLSGVFALRKISLADPAELY